MNKEILIVFQYENDLYIRQHDLKPVYFDFFSEIWRKFLIL